MNNFFKDLFVLEMANNHQGSLEHGIRIVEEASTVVYKFGVNAGIKLQFRDLDTFIHPEYMDRTDLKHIPRFMSTRLNKKEFQQILLKIEDFGLRRIVTPFDERSVDLCESLGVDILKVASCSATDWPLLEKIASTGKPVIASTGGLKLEKIDNLVTFFAHKNIEFALMHCVSIYPTPNDQAQLGFLKRMKQRYPGISVGYSGHEAPDNNDIVMQAVSVGADMLERHIGVETKGIKLNKYSMTPKQLDKWFQNYFIAKDILGSAEDKVMNKDETDSLLSLQRGVYAKKKIIKGSILKKSDVFFCYALC